MTGKQYRAALERLGLSQQGYARMIGLAPTTIRRRLHTGVTGEAELIIRLLLAGVIGVDHFQTSAASRD